jgi:hypothetical protein
VKRGLDKNFAQVSFPKLGLIVVGCLFVTSKAFGFCENLAGKMS